MTQGFIVVTAIISVYIIVKCIQKLEENLSTKIDKRFERLKEFMEKEHERQEKKIREDVKNYIWFDELKIKDSLDKILNGEKKDKKTKKSLANKK